MTDNPDAPERELRAETEIAASPARVWAALTDFRNLADASPELITMKPLLPGGLRLGQNYLGLNRRKGILWPTRNIIVALEDQRTIAWDTTSSGARWIFELTATPTGTHLTQRRPIPHKRATIGKVFAARFLGGAAGHDKELEAAMSLTLEHLKRVVEA